MLDDLKNIYYQKADVLDSSWKKLSGNELCFKYIECLNTQSLENLDNYLSAIIYKFWSVAVKAYYSQGLKLAAPEDCYNWLIDSILYVLKHHVWTDPTHNLFNDPRAPEKAINVVFTSTKINYFVSLTRQKRKVDTQSLSLETISEEKADSYFLPVYDNYNFLELNLIKLIKKLYKSNEYFSSICLDLVLNENLIDRSNNQVLQYKKLKKRLRSLDDNYAKFFSALYDVPYDSLLRSVQYISNLSNIELDVKISRFFNELQHNKELISILH